jgi:hypothetical protein
MVPLIKLKTPIGKVRNVLNKLNCATAPGAVNYCPAGFSNPLMGMPLNLA